MVFYSKIKNDEKINLGPPLGSPLAGVCSKGGSIKTVDCKLELYEAKPVFSDPCKIIIGSNPIRAEGKIEKCICRYKDTKNTCESKGSGGSIYTPTGSEPTSTTGWCREEKETTRVRVTTTYGTGNNALADCNQRANSYCDSIDAQGCPEDIGAPTEPAIIKCCVSSTVA